MVSFDDTATTIKLLTALVIFVSGLGSTLVPLVIADKGLFSVGVMSSSGVLLGAGLCHQLADSSNVLDNETTFPWSFFICGLTFMLFMIFEETIHLFLIGDHSHAHNNGGDTLPELQDGDRESFRRTSCRGSVPIISVDAILEASENQDVYYQHAHFHSHEETRPISLPRASNDQHCCHEKLSMTNFHEKQRQTTADTRNNIFENAARRHSSVHHHHDDHIAEHLHGSLVASVMLLLALSVHSILAGLSVGIISDSKSITSAVIAIVAHKIFAGYALGSTMLAAELSLDRHVILALVFSCSTPLGILIGLFSSNGNYDEDSTTVGVVHAIVAGTFVYVAIIEVGMKELLICRQDLHDELTLTLTEKQIEALKLVGMLIGFLAMSLLALWL